MNDAPWPSTFVGASLEPEPEPGPPLVAGRSRLFGLGRHKFTLEELHAIDTADGLPAWREIRVRLGVVKDDRLADACRTLDAEMDRRMRYESRTWSTPLTGDANYGAAVSGCLQTAARFLGIGFRPESIEAPDAHDPAAIAEGWIRMVSAPRRERLWGDPYPAWLREEMSR